MRHWHLQAWVIHFSHHFCSLFLKYCCNKSGGKMERYQGYYSCQGITSNIRTVAHVCVIHKNKHRLGFLSPIIGNTCLRRDTSLSQKHQYKQENNSPDREILRRRVPIQQQQKKGWDMRAEVSKQVTKLISVKELHFIFPINRI